jgi:initiation factor 1A
MVKNSGGNKTKGAARKLLVSRPSSKLRKSEREDEKYAYVTKVCGGRICHVKTLCGIEFICHIRGKFSGRNKSSNFISLGSLLLVGVRDFGKNECDVIEVYNPSEVELLKQMPDIDLSDMHKYINPYRNASSTCVSTIIEDELEDVFIFKKAKGETKVDEEVVELIYECDSETKINIDDI